MLSAVPFFVAFRYFYSKGSERFASVASLIAIGGIALAVTALVTVLSVVNGFEEQLRSRVLGVVQHVTLFPTRSVLTDWRAVSQRLAARPNVAGIAPYVELKGIVQGADGMHGMLLFGIDAEAEGRISVLPQQVIQGRYADLRLGSDALMLGEHLAEKLKVKLGDRLIVTIPTHDPASGEGALVPRPAAFRVTAIYRSGTLLDQTHAFIALDTAALRGGLPEGAVTGLHVKLNDVFASHATMLDLYRHLTPDYHLRDWMADYGPLFRHVASSKRLVFLSVSVILAVACFNILSVLLVTVHSRVEDIAVLRTLGATQSTIVGLFVVLGGLIASVGIAAGTAVGVLLAHGLDDLFNWAERLSGRRLLSLDTYMVGYLSPTVDWTDVVGIAFLALCLSVLASVYPAWRASRTDPAEVL